MIPPPTPTPIPTSEQINARIRGKHIPITLSDPVICCADLIGLCRHYSAKKDKKEDPWGGSKPEDEVKKGHRYGACAEAAVCVYKNRFWKASVDGFKEVVDCGELTEVRWTETRGLIFRKGDDPKRKYVLCTGESPTFYIEGWLWGYEIHEDKYWIEPKPPSEKYPKPRSGYWSAPIADLRPY